jgi:hypothetical protein
MNTTSLLRTKLVLLTGILLLIWSAFAAPTFQYPFHWDDFHLIRHYTGPELVSVFHGLVDPDKIETPGLRPFSILLYNVQGSLLGENIFWHRAFMIVMIWLFLSAVGIVLLELGLHFYQIALVFVLFISSRLFASLVLWISLSHLLFAYIFIVLTAYFFLLWVKRQRRVFLFLMLASVAVATFTREEAYTLPMALPLLWWISTGDRTRWREVAVAAFSIFVIVCFHYWLWHFLIPDALSPQFNLAAAKRFVTAVKASCLPGGSTMIGSADKLLGFLWIGFLLGLVLIFLRLSRPNARWQLAGICCLGILFCLPALAVARAFGIALPTLAFMTGISIAIGEVYHQIGSSESFREWQRYAFVGIVILGLSMGIAGGFRRSVYVAESLQQNCAVRAERDGEFLFDMFKRPATIPEERRRAGLARLSALGIQSADDVRGLQRDLKENPSRFRQNSANHEGLFLPKYEYLSF